MRYFFLFPIISPINDINLARSQQLTGRGKSISDSLSSTKFHLVSNGQWQAKGYFSPDQNLLSAALGLFGGGDQESSPPPFPFWPECATRNEQL